MRRAVRTDLEEMRERPKRPKRLITCVIASTSLLLSCGPAPAGPGRIEERAMPSEIPPNGLEGSESAYLRSGAESPVRWQEYGDEAFGLAVDLDRPILLDIGAIWCHWCHVMDRETYEDETVSALINDLYIPVKVDRDMRPDLDSRFQAASRALGGGGGWPLTLILTPRGDPIWSGTYLPPERMEEILREASDWYAENGTRLAENPGALMRAVTEGEDSFPEPGTVTDETAEPIVEAVMNGFDGENGGWGEAPKFPSPAAVDLAVEVGRRRNDEALIAVARRTIEGMLHGGVYDQLGGGLHRYGVDEAWRVPHFEKMLYDNAGLIGNLAVLYETTRDDYFLKALSDEAAWVRGSMTDPDGGFYASQDADYSMNDDGDYYTWTVDEAVSALSAEEWSVVERYYDIRPDGEMRENPAKNVLHIAEDIEVTAGALGYSPAEAESLLSSARSKLLAVRSRRPMPRIDRTIYVNWNAMMITAYLRAHAETGNDGFMRDARASADRLLSEAYLPGEGFTRGLAEPGPDGRRISIGAPGGYLDDQAWMLLALSRLSESTGEEAYLAAAVDLATNVLPGFRDSERGGFMDLPVDGRDQAPGVGVRRIQDGPTPSSNSTVALGLLALASASGEESYREEARETLEAFAGTAPRLGLSGSSFALAVERYLHPAST